MKNYTTEDLIYFAGFFDGGKKIYRIKYVNLIEEIKKLR